MTGLLALWLPIVVSAVFVFIVSAVIHMLPLWHRNDYPSVPDEEGFRSAVGPLAIPSGDYMVPRAPTQADMRSPEFNEKLEQGPVLIMTVFPNGPATMGRSLSLWFLYTIVVSIFAAYVAGRALAPGADYLSVHRFAGVTAFAGYVLALLQMSIWYRRGWSYTIKDSFDGLIYALLTGGVFGWLWPV